MRTVSAQFLEAIRNPPGGPAIRVEAWRSGVRVDTYGDAGIPIHAGEVQVDGTKATQRTLSGLQVEATTEMWDLLSPVGTQLRCYRGFRFGPGLSELVPVGWFVIESLTENYGGQWDGTVDAAPDLMWNVQRSQFPGPRTFSAGTPIRTVISTLLSEIVGSVNITATSTATLPSTTVFERDRLQAVTDSAASIGALVFIDADGTPTLADMPTIQPTTVWDADAGPTGVMYSAARKRSMDGVYSAVSASPSNTDGTPTFSPQVVKDTNPQSPTYYLGPFGLVPFFMSSDKFQNAGQALAAAAAKLPLVSATRAEFDLTAECNPALQAWDTINVTLPRRSRDEQPITERHMVAQFTVPLTPDGVQSISTRSTVADLTSE